jgi:hypothetical protein
MSAPPQAPPTTPLERLDQDENELDLLNCLADPGDPLSAPTRGTGENVAALS